MKKALLILLGTPLLYALTIIGLNLYAWSQFKPPGLWRETQNFSPEEAAAGKLYLQTILNKSLTPEEFQSALTPILKEKRWGFLYDDPTLYLIDGKMGQPGDSVKRDEILGICIPLGTSKKMAQAFRDSAKKDLEEGNSEKAAEKITFPLQIANHLAQPYDLVTVLIALSLTDIAVTSLEENPNIPITPTLKEELEKIINNPFPLLEMGYEEEFKWMKTIPLTGQKRGDLPNHITLFTNPDGLNNFEKEWWKFYHSKAPKDFDSFLKSYLRKNFFTTGPYQGLLILNGTPFPPTDKAKFLQRDLQTRAKKLLERTTPQPTNP